MSTPLQQNIEGLIAVFHSYSGKEGNKFKLSKAELKNLLKEELPNLLDGNQDSEEVDKIMTDLDTNRDGQVDFQEFVEMVVTLTVACHQFFRILNY